MIPHRDIITLTAESKEELKTLLMNIKEENEKDGLKLNIQKTKIMTSGPITSWQIEGGKLQTVTDFIFLSSKITADSDCSHEIKRHLLLGRKVMTSLNSVVATHSSILAWRIPWTEEPGRLQSMGSQRVGHD